ncbi:MAG: radical SAM protein, partial [Desulfobulbaceae bacterium]|nr:radical SAM protein [Desulfobulbaceae bacterium]
GRLPVAIIFPNEYRVGMSNLGFQLVFDLVNSDPDIVCERFFLPSRSCRPLSIESDRPLRDFPVILCSVSFENDYLNLLKIFLMSGISPLAVDRAASNPIAAPGWPLVICGGVATFINPEPLAPFVDMFIVGEAEPVLPAVMEYLKKWLKEKERESLLREMAGRFDGCYVPHFYEVIYHEDGTLASVSGPPDLPALVKRVILPETDTAGHSRILTPDAEFADLFLVELGRGCSRGCRFCAAGFVYRPPRLWNMDAIINGLSRKPREINRVGLLGMEMARPDDLALLAGHMLKESYSLSFSSLRADAVSPPLLELLEKSNVKSAAIAPDGSSERLRRVINKGIT